jgi:hypothetical protein
VAHDGRSLPVALASQPGVAFRNGWRVPPGQYPASHWLEFGRDFWRHVGAPLDIVAFLPSYLSPAAARCRSALCSISASDSACDADEGINDRSRTTLLRF